MKKQTIIAMLIIISVLISSCKTKKNCDAYGMNDNKEKNINS